MYVLADSYVYVDGYYNGLYYEYKDGMKVLSDIYALCGGYADSYVLGDPSHTAVYYNGYGSKLSRLTSDKYISHYVSEYDHKLYMNRYTASSAQELAEKIGEGGFDYEIVIDFNADIYDVSGSLETIDGTYVGSWFAKNDGNKIICNLKDLIDNGELVSGEKYKIELTNIKKSRYSVENIDIVFTYQPTDEGANAVSEKLETAAMSLFKNSFDVALFAADKGIAANHVHSFTTETVMPALEADEKITNTCGKCGNA